MELACREPLLSQGLPGPTGPVGLPGPTGSSGLVVSEPRDPAGAPRPCPPAPAPSPTTCDLSSSGSSGGARFAGTSGESWGSGLGSRDQGSASGPLTQLLPPRGRQGSQEPLVVTVSVEKMENEEPPACRCVLGSLSRPVSGPLAWPPVCGMRRAGHRAGVVKRHWGPHAGLPQGSPGLPGPVGPKGEPGPMGTPGQVSSTLPPTSAAAPLPPKAQRVPWSGQEAVEWGEGRRRAHQAVPTGCSRAPRSEGREGEWGGLEGRAWGGAGTLLTPSLTREPPEALLETCWESR